MSQHSGDTVRWREEHTARLGRIDKACNEAKRQWNVPAAHAALSVMRALLRAADRQDWLAAATHPAPDKPIAGSDSA